MKKTYYILDKVAFISICLYFLDVVVLGTGVLTRIGPLSTRIVFAMVSVACVIPIAFSNIKEFLSSKYIVLILLFYIMLLIGFIHGIINQNSYTIIRSDVLGFVHLTMTLPLICCMRTQKRVFTLWNVITYALDMYAIVTILLTFYQMLPNNMVSYIYNILDKSGIGAISTLGGNAVRVFLHTGSRLFIMAFLFYLIMSIINKECKKSYIVRMSVLIVAIFVSYTRSLYLGIFVAFFVALILAGFFLRDIIKNLLINLCIAVCLAVLVIVGLSSFQQTNLFSVAIERCLLAGNDVVDDNKGISGEEIDSILQESTGGTHNEIESGIIENENLLATESESGDELENITAEMENLTIRSQRQSMALENFKKNPLFGCGLGTVNDPKGGHIELFYLDILSKMGIVGLLVFLTPYIMAIYDFIRKKYESMQRYILFICIITLTYAITFSYFNPFMNSAVGLMLYALCISQTFRWTTADSIQNM